MFDQLLKVSGQVLQPIRNRVSSKKGAVQSASSCSGERPGRAGEYYFSLTHSRKQEASTLGISSRKSASRNTCKGLAPQIRHGPVYPSRFPSFTPDTVQGCSVKSVDCRSYLNVVSKPGPFSTIPWWRGNELQSRNFSYFSYFSCIT